MHFLKKYIGITLQNWDLLCFVSNFLCLFFFILWAFSHYQICFLAAWFLTPVWHAIIGMYHNFFKAFPIFENVGFHSFDFINNKINMSYIQISDQILSIIAINYLSKPSIFLYSHHYFHNSLTYSNNSLVPLPSGFLSTSTFSTIQTQ